MAHYRKRLGIAVGLNTAIIVGEAVGAWQANSLSLLMDSIHNLSDEIALGCVWLAFLLSTALSQTLLLSANLLNSLGLVVMSAVLVWEAIARLLHPIPIVCLMPVFIVLCAAAGNGGVAWWLREPGAHNTTIWLAYVHSIDTMLVRWFPERAAVGKLLFHHSRMITMEEKAHDHPSDSQCAGEHDRGDLVCGL